MPVKMCTSLILPRIVFSFDKCTADISVGAGRAKNRMHLDSLAKNISSNKRHSFCSIYLSVISDLIKTRSQHITKRKTLLIDMCNRSLHPKTVSAIAQRLQAYQESLSESSVAVQMQSYTGSGAPTLTFSNLQLRPPKTLSTISSSGWGRRHSSGPCS